MGVTSAAPPNTMFLAWGGICAQSGLGAFSGANKIQLSGFYLPEPTSFTNIVLRVVIADAANNYDWGIYDVNGNLRAHVGAHTVGSTGIVDLAVVGGPILLQPGKYYFAFTGAANTANLSQSGAGAQCGNITFLISTESVTVSSGGVLPASITIPADSWNNGAATVHGFALHS